MTIHFETRGRVALITIDRLHARNSLDFEHFGELANAWLRFRDDDELWVAIITGKEDVFCVGADLKQFVPMVTDDIESLASGESVLGGDRYPPNAPLIAVLRDFELYKPVIAAVNGICAAGGIEMLHGMDIRIASDRARFAVAEARRGLFPGGGTTVHLPRHIAYCHAMEMLLTADYVDATRAYEFGLVNRVVPHERILDEAFAFADKILANGPCAIRAIKEAVLKGLKLPLQQALDEELGYAAQVFATEDAIEGPMAFAQKRARLEGALMDFAFSDETKLLCESLRKFLASEVLPLEREHAALIDGGRMSAGVMELGAGIRRKAVDAGFYTAHLSEALGGAGLDHVTVTALREEIARSGSEILGIFVIGDPPMGPTPMLAMLDAEQRPRFLEPLIRGEKTTCFALTEPNAGSDVGRMETFAARDGDSYVLNGSKVYISNGLHADFLQVFALTKRPEPDENPMFGCISLFMVDADSPGLGRKLMRSMGGDDFQAELSFEDVRVPAANRVGEEGFGFLGASQWLSGERLMMAIQAVGLARYALDLGVEWAKTRQAFGKTIGKFQGVSFPLADCATELEAARWLTYRTAWLLDQGESAFAELAMAKVFASEALAKVADQVLQTLGGVGYMTEHPIERIYRMARVFRIGGGTSEIQRRLIAKSLGL